MTGKFPLVFIDTNIFLDFYRSEGEAGISLLQRINKLHEHLITTDQVEVEFLNNRQRVILGALQKLKPHSSQIIIPAYLSESQTAASIEKQLKSVNQKISTLRKRLEKVLQNPAGYDPVYKVANALFDDQAVLNLRWKPNEQGSILAAAASRFARGFSPRKLDDTSMGDAINWEWILHCSKTSTKDVIVVSRDSDYGVRLDGRNHLNNWLLEEFKRKVGPRKRIEYTTSLSHAFKKLDVEVTAEEKEAEEKIIAAASPDLDVHVLWQQVLAAMQPISAFTHVYLKDATGVQLANNVLTVAFMGDSKDVGELLNNAKTIERLKSVLTKLGHPDIQVRILVDPPA